MLYLADYWTLEELVEELEKLNQELKNYRLKEIIENFKELMKDE